MNIVLAVASASYNHGYNFEHLCRFKIKVYDIVVVTFLRKIGRKYFWFIRTLMFSAIV